MNNSIYNVQFGRIAVSRPAVLREKIFPDEILMKIFHSLHEKDLYDSIRLVCKDWKRIVRDKQVWISFLRKYPIFELKEVKNLNTRIRESIAESKPWLPLIPKSWRMEVLREIKIIPVDGSFKTSERLAVLSYEVLNILNKKGVEEDDEEIYIPIELVPQGFSPAYIYSYTNHGHCSEPKFNGPKWLPLNPVKQAFTEKKNLMVKHEGRTFHIHLKNEWREVSRNESDYQQIFNFSFYKCALRNDIELIDRGSIIKSLE